MLNGFMVGSLQYDLFVNPQLYTIQLHFIMISNIETIAEHGVVVAQVQFQLCIIS